MAGTFLDYQRLITKIPEQWKVIISDNGNVHITNLFNVTCSLYTKFLIKDKKECGTFYDIMIRANETSTEYRK